MHASTVAAAAGLSGPQENPNAIPEGETPHNVTLLCYDPMTDATKPGDRITVTGIYKARAARCKEAVWQLKSCCLPSSSPKCPPSCVPACSAINLEGRICVRVLMPEVARPACMRQRPEGSTA